MSLIQTEPVRPTIRYQQFSVPMAKGLWNDRKTQTRRKFRGIEELRPGQWHIHAHGGGLLGVRTRDVSTDALDYTPMQKGDLVCVREPWRVSKHLDGYAPVSSKKPETPILPVRLVPVFYEAGGVCRNVEKDDGADPVWQFVPPQSTSDRPPWAGKYRQAMHMPRWASRMTLEITDVRVERLLDITREDAMAEGIEYETADPGFWYVPGIDTALTAVGIEQMSDGHEQAVYFKLWDWINGERAHLQNPWVVAYTFTVHKRNVDDLLELKGQ